MFYLTYAIEESDLTYEELEDIIANEKIEPGYMDKMIEDEAEQDHLILKTVFLILKLKIFILMKLL